MLRHRMLRIPPWCVVLFFGFLIPQVALAGIPRPQSTHKPKQEWIQDPGRVADISMPAGTLIDTQLYRVSLRPSESMQSTNELEKIEDEIFYLKRKRNRRYGLAGPIVYTILGGLAMLTGSIILLTSLGTLGAGDSETALTLMIVGGSILLGGLWLFLSNLAKWTHNIRRRRPYDRKIRLLQERRKMLMSGKRPVDPPPPRIRKRPLPPDGPPPGGPPPGGPPPDGPPPEGSFVPLIGFNF